MEEKTFLNTNEITVTNARFIVPSQTYAVANITSVKNVEELPKRFFPFAVESSVPSSLLVPPGLVFSL